MSDKKTVRKSSVNGKLYVTNENNEVVEENTLNRVESGVEGVGEEQTEKENFPSPPVEG